MRVAGEIIKKVDEKKVDENQQTQKKVKVENSREQRKSKREESESRRGGEESESGRGGITGTKSRPKPVAPANRLPIIRFMETSFNYPEYDGVILI